MGIQNDGSLSGNERGGAMHQQVLLAALVGAAALGGISEVGTSLSDATGGAVESAASAWEGEGSAPYSEEARPGESSSADPTSTTSGSGQGPALGEVAQVPAVASEQTAATSYITNTPHASDDSSDGSGGWGFSLFGGVPSFVGGVPWGNILKGAAIVGAAVAVTVAVVVAAPVGLAVAAIVGVAAAVVAATLIETGEATVHGIRTGDWDYSEALDPGQALGSFVVEGARGLAIVANPQNWDDIYDNVRECPSCMFQQMADNFETCFAAGDSAACVQAVTEAATWVGAGQVVTAPARSALFATRPGALVASQAAAARTALAATRPALFASSNMAAARAAALATRPVSLLTTRLSSATSTLAATPPMTSLSNSIAAYSMRLPLSLRDSLDLPPLSADEASQILDELYALDAQHTLSAEETSQLLSELDSLQADDALRANPAPTVSVVDLDELAPQLQELQASMPPGVRRRPMPDGSSPLRPPNADIGELYPTIAMDPRHAYENSRGVTYFETPEDRGIYAMEVRDGSLHDGFLPISETTNPNGYIYAMDGRGDFFVSADAELGSFHHSSFLAGDPVAAAGHIWEIDGIVYINNNSGHYQPPPGMIENAKTQLIEMGVDADSIVVLDKDSLPPGIEAPVAPPPNLANLSARDLDELMR